jgi:hypothetical protein
MDRQAAFLDAEFRIMYRMSRRSLERLRHELYPFLRVKLSDAQIEGRAHGNRRPLTIDEKIGIGLMTAAGDSIGGILQGFNTGLTCANDTIEKFFDAVYQSEIGKIQLPMTLHELQAASDAYSTKRSYNMNFFAHIGALDGLAVRIPCPSKEETDYPLDFMTRKGFFAVNAQAIVDAHDKCISLSVKCTGTTHDSTAWSVSNDSENWKNCTLVDPRSGRRFWISEDDAYKATANQVPPWPGTGLISRAPYKDSFNYYLSGGCRNGVERLFGQVYQRWGMLWRPLRYPLKRVPKIVHCLFQLHNFLKDVNDTNLPELNSGPGACQANELRRAIDAADGFDDQFYYSDECFDERQDFRVRTGQCPIREEITRTLERKGILRPPVDEGSLVVGVQL